MNKMLTHLNGYKREAVLAPLFKMLEATFDLFVPLVMADIVNVGIAAHDLHYILVRCGILLLLAVIGLTCSLTAQYFSAKAAVGYSTSLRHALFEHIQKLGFTEMDTLGTSTLITRMTSDINQVQSGLNLFLRLFLRSPFVVVGAMVMAFTVNARAAWIFVVAIPLLSIVVFGIMVLTNPLYKTAQTRLDRVLGLTRENLTGVRVVRAFDKEKSEIDRFESANDLLTKMQLHVGHLSSLMSPLTYVIINLAIVALLYVGSIEINIGGMAAGDVIALVNYMNQILVELVKLANLIVQVSKALACAGRVQAVLDTKPGMEFPAQLTGNVPAEKAGGRPLQQVLPWEKLVDELAASRTYMELAGQHSGLGLLFLEHQQQVIMLFKNHIRLYGKGGELLFLEDVRRYFSNYVAAGSPTCGRLRDVLLQELKERDSGNMNRFESIAGGQRTYLGHVIPDDAPPRPDSSAVWDDVRKRWVH